MCTDLLGKLSITSIHGYVTFYYYASIELVCYN